MNLKLVRIICGGALCGLGIILEHTLPAVNWAFIALYAASYALCGYDVLYRALKNIMRGKVFDENFLMALATAGAFCILQFAEAAAVMLFYQAGEMFQEAAVEKSKKSITALMDIRPDYANLKTENGIVKTSPEVVARGDVIVVSAGERIPLDGVIISGATTLDTSALTGEALPREAGEGSAVLSGCVNLSGTIEVRVKSEFGQSTVNKILDLVQNAAEKKTRSESFITRFAKYYTPAVVLSALILAFVPPFFTGFDTLSQWIYRALSFLVVSCPCALVISVPLGFFGGLGGAARAGVLIKGSNYIEALAKADTAVFDKTGTLTKGVFTVCGTEPQGKDPTALLMLAARAQCRSSHPIAKSIRAALDTAIADTGVSDIIEIAGRGVKATVDGKAVLAGNAKLLEENGIEFVCPHLDGTAVYVAEDGAYAGRIILQDELREGAAQTVKSLKEMGIKQTVMLTGDNAVAAERAVRDAGIDRFYAGLLPQDKLQRLEEIMTSSRSGTVFAGDGINDAPVLTRADVGVAMGGLGSDAAIEAADAVIMTDEITKLARVIRICRRAVRIVKQNIVFAIAVKLAVLILSALGIVSLWAAVFADVGVTLIAVLNSLRTLKVRN